MIRMTCFYLFLLLISSCAHQDQPVSLENKREKSLVTDLDQLQAERLAALPLKCLEQEYPNKLGQVVNSDSELKSPQELHPIFYGCFDWHSSVHGHWLLVTLLKRYPDMKQADEIRRVLNAQFTAKKMQQELAFFETKFNDSFERTYGWAWILKLQEELLSWDDPDAQKWATVLQPMTDLLVEKFQSFLPKLIYPIRSGEHVNTAFGMSFAYDYAVAVSNDSLKILIENRAADFFAKDLNYPFSFEPSGYDFLSPALQEVDLMRKTMDKKEFKAWVKAFLPALYSKNFNPEVGRVGDRSDGKLVHLDGLNFSRAWCLYDLAKHDPDFKHLKKLADQHLNYSLPSIVDGDYMGEHWLASFAVYALLKK